jgi:hypothetical protein
MGAGVIALDCQSPFKKRHGLRGVCRHHQEDVRKCAQNEIIGIQIFRPFAFDALDLRFTQARFDRTDDVQGDFVLQGKNVVERTVISFGPDMNAGFGLDQLAGDTHLLSSFTHAAFEQISHAKFTPHLARTHRLTFIDEAGIARDDEKPLYT